jgi:hypothetical protein
MGKDYSFWSASGSRRVENHRWIAFINHRDLGSEGIFSNKWSLQHWELIFFRQITNPVEEGWMCDDSFRFSIFYNVR